MILIWNRLSPSPTSDIGFKRVREMLVFHDWFLEISLWEQDSPASRVLLLRVEEAGGVQLTAHQRGRTLIADDLRPALRPRVTVQPASCSTQLSSNKPVCFLTISQDWLMGKLTMVMCIFPTRPLSLSVSVSVFDSLSLSVSVSSQRWTHLRLGIIAQVILTSHGIRTGPKRKTEWWRTSVQKTDGD